MRRTLTTLFVLLSAVLSLGLAPGTAWAQARGKGRNGPPPTFEEATKKLERIEGLFTLFRDPESNEYLIAVTPEQLDEDFMLSIARDTGIGQWFLLATMDLGENPVRFHKVGKNVQLILRNARFTAREDRQMARAVRRSFSDSLLGSSPIVSEPDPKTKAVLVDIRPFFVTDVEGLSTILAQAARAMYMPDPGNSYFTSVKGFPGNIEIGARMHFVGKKPVNFVNLVDPRSLFVTYRYSLSRIPETPDYIPRIADDRVGNFITLYRDFSDDTRPSNYVRFVTRWDLRKEEPYAEISKPIKPITYWLENSIPKQYRKAVADGILVWNKAFEKIGFKDAIVVKQQPDDADWDPADSRYASVRWLVTTSGAFAIGPSRINPWTGQIYDADIGVAEAIVRTTRSEYREQVDPLAAMRALAESVNALPRPGEDPRLACSLGAGVAQEAAFGSALLRARGMEPGSDEEDQYIHDFITHVIAHEVGHTLGLRHNFRASRLHPVKQLQDAEETRSQGLTGSVMDYIPVNIAPKGQTQGQYWQTTLGPYDYWAIEYAYTTFPGVKKPSDELPELEKIAGRVAAHGNAYGTDEDINDPGTNRWDIGDDPQEFYENRVALARELWKEIPSEFAKDGQGYQVMRRAFTRGLNEFVPAVLNITKNIGGVYTFRDHIGDEGGRLPMKPVSAARQRRALEFLRKELFASDSFDLPADLLNRLAATRWWDFDFSIFRMSRMEFPIHDVVLQLQEFVLTSLFNPVKLDTLVDLEMQYPEGTRPFTMMEMFRGVQSAIWSEVYTPGNTRIDSFRRGAQRGHLKRMVKLVVDPAPGVPEDACTMGRFSLVELEGKIAGALKRPGLDTATRAHLEESWARIDAALKAQINRRAS
ncbi:MAG: zinc-dependent metalloprotease [Acidobacteriota bacterium]